MRSSASARSIWSVAKRSPEPGGFSWLRMEVADDMGVAMVMKQQARGRSEVMLAPRTLSIDWYPSFGAMVRGFDKNAFAASCGFRASKAIASVALVWAAVAALFVAALQPWVPWLRLAPVLYFLSQASSARTVGQRLGRPWLVNMLAPAGLVIVGFIVARSTFLTLGQGGIRWRGTFYPHRPASRLAAGEAVAFPLPAASPRG